MEDDADKLAAALAAWRERRADKLPNDIDIIIMFLERILARLDFPDRRH